jgi:hypothetical protein
MKNVSNMFCSSNPGQVIPHQLDWSQLISIGTIKCYTMMIIIVSSRTVLKRKKSSVNMTWTNKEKFTVLIHWKEFLLSNMTSCITLLIQKSGKFNETLVAYKCLKKCIKMENSKFARQCKKDGGYFKCCGSYWWMDMFEEARNKLIKDGIIEANTSEICDSKSLKNPCLYCSMNAICTKSNPFTGGISFLLSKLYNLLPLFIHSYYLLKNSFITAGSESFVVIKEVRNVVSVLFA